MKLAAARVTQWAAKGRLRSIQVVPLCSFPTMQQTAGMTISIGGGLIGYVMSKPFGNGQIISIDDLAIVVITAVFHKKLI